MEWHHPEWLYLIVPLAAGWLGLALWSRRRRLRAAEAFVAQAMWPRILPADSRARFWVKTLLRELALVAGLVALAGPRWGTQFEEVVPRGSDLYVLIDVSRSMLAEDVPPSRLGRAKADVAALVNRLEGERIGLIAFAGQAVVKCPLTVDYEAFRRALDELDTTSAPRGGTAIGDAIRKALEVFHAKTERDQALLLITDGDDQQSYPLDAAAVAAERQVTIFAVGLGDASQGARIPQDKKPGSYVEYQGEQVWSKLDSSLLEQIALKTSGIYIPVGTRAYDLGELYADYLKGRRGDAAEARKRIRRAEQFQAPLALALIALLVDLVVRPYREERQALRVAQTNDDRLKASARATVSAGIALFAFFSAAARADDPTSAVREGLQLYRNDEFDKAQEKFAAARELFDKERDRKATLAAFDEACALHRQGDVERAREAYLQAGLAHDRNLAAAAHYNLGTLAAEQARTLAGEDPENVPPEKRQEIVDQLKGAVASFRHSLELRPDNQAARRDIELVRQWIKYYADRWHERDRQKRRQKTNLLAFLEFLIETQKALRESVNSLPATAPADAFAELKRLQDELRQEIPPLQEKIEAELSPPQAAGGKPAQAGSKEVQEGIALLSGWAGTAGDKMSSASSRLNARQAQRAAEDQQAAIDELEKIWEAVVPFHPLLARDLRDQTNIAGALRPESREEEKREEAQPGEGEERAAKSNEEQRAASDEGLSAAHARLESEGLAPFVDLQEHTRRRTTLLELKAAAELERLKNTPPPGGPQPDDESNEKAKHVDPEQLKVGYEKAIDLAPRAVEQMDLALKALRQNDRGAAYQPAEEARKILEEIQKAQPRDEQQDRKQDQEQKDEQQKQDQQKQDQQKKDERSQDKKDQEHKRPDEQQKKDEEQNKQDQQKQSGQQQKQAEQKQVSRDRMEEALRKVRERQQEKHERDRRMKARISGRAPVEKDW